MLQVAIVCNTVIYSPLKFIPYTTASCSYVERPAQLNMASSANNKKVNPPHWMEIKNWPLMSLT